LLAAMASAFVGSREARKGAGRSGERLRAARHPLWRSSGVWQRRRHAAKLSLAMVGGHIGKESARGEPVERVSEECSEGALVLPFP
jgi:hypothetical protein